ncbi:hypothetical protein L5515_004974 [Caenorhabditis briggsae]|uniref:Uncharacterized protein n=1 Tax=Caenorhabditis briggsae TaxID=6238 RepID=A0AAE9JE94_CAEBR|nr:hypothetical protein L5515_004974 [Caenorhabditis briggsae]
MIEEVSTPVLLFVTSNCISRLSNREFERLLTSQEDTFAEEARKLWYHYKSNFSCHNYCNACGEGLLSSHEKCNKCVDSATATFVRIEAHTGRVGNITYDCKITTCCADQPAKRSFFGMKGHSSKVIAPYNTPIDILHNTGEGLFDRIRKEIFPPDTKFIRKSDLFVIDPSSFARDIRRVYMHSNYENIENLRNGSDKTHHLRLTLALTALVSDSMKPKARLVLIALGFLTNKMYSNTQAPTLFDIQLSAAAAWYLAEANKEYITMKTHELLYHLADYFHHTFLPSKCMHKVPPTYKFEKRNPTVNQKWSPIGFAATQLYDMETGSAFDRETCERNIEKMIKNDRDIDYMEWLNLASKLCNWTSTQFDAHTKRLALHVWDAVDNADELLVCYGSSQKANKYVPVNPSIFTKMSDYIIAGFGQTNSQDRKTQVISYLQSSLENKLNRVRARYNAKFGKSQSEQAAIWLHDELMKGEASELKSHPLNFNSSNVSGEDAPNFSGTPNYDGSGDDVDDSIDIEGC